MQGGWEEIWKWGTRNKWSKQVTNRTDNWPYTPMQSKYIQWVCLKINSSVYCACKSTKTKWKRKMKRERKRKKQPLLSSDLTAKHWDAIDKTFQGTMILLIKTTGLPVELQWYQNKQKKQYGCSVEWWKHRNLNQINQLLWHLHIRQFYYIRFVCNKS